MVTCLTTSVDRPSTNPPPPPLPWLTTPTLNHGGYTTMIQVVTYRPGTMCRQSLFQNRNE
jgi:hypothetical protein